MDEASTKLRQAKALLADVVALDLRDADGSDSDLIAVTTMAEELSRLLDVIKTRCAGEIAFRSRRELGDSGLAATHGHVNAPSLLSTITLSGYQEANRRIRVGAVLHDAARADDTEDSSAKRHAPDALFNVIAEAVVGGDLGVEAADVVIRTLGPVVDDVESSILESATATLVSAAAERNADEVGAMARRLRDSLDRAGVADREEHLRSRRALKRGRVVDGLRRVSLVLDPESDVVLVGALDAAMSPRFGPRFTDPAANRPADSLVADSRSNEQMALDILVGLVQLGADADPTLISSSLKPAVRVTMTVDDLLNRVQARTAGAVGASEASLSSAVSGVAVVEGHPELVSAATARRFLCDQGALPIVLSGAGQPVDVGRAVRLFTAAQRVALSVRDGGCRWPTCDRPPSWTESHHIVEFQHGGKTDVKDGILLCRRHHLLLHNSGWLVLRQDGTDPTYWLRPPKRLDASQKLIAMPPKVIQPHERVRASA